MKTPYLDKRIPFLKKCLHNGFVDKLDVLTVKEELAELEAIKSIIENTPIISTPDKPVWVVDESGNKRILLADFGDKCAYRYITVCFNDADDFLNNEEFDWTYHNEITPYTPKVTIEVTEEETSKVEEFLKTLRKNETN